MNVNPKSAFVLLHKLREAMGVEIAASGELSGEVEVGGAFFGSRTRPENRKADRRQQRREDSRQQVVVIARERGEKARTWVAGKEADAVPRVRNAVDTLPANETTELCPRYVVQPGELSRHVSTDGADKL